MVVILLLALGLLMVSSTSIVIANKWHHFAFYYLVKQLIFLSLGLILIVVFIRTPIQIWYQKSYYILFLGIIALLLVLVPGIGHKVNGSMRWIHLGFFNAQPSELTKLAFIIYMASYINRYHALLNEDVSSFLRPILLLGLVVYFIIGATRFWCSRGASGNGYGDAVSSWRAVMAISSLIYGSFSVFGIACGFFSVSSTAADDLP